MSNTLESIARRIHVRRPQAVPHVADRDPTFTGVPQLGNNASGLPPADNLIVERPRVAPTLIPATEQPSSRKIVASLPQSERDAALERFRRARIATEEHYRELVDDRREGIDAPVEPYHGRRTVYESPQLSPEREVRREEEHNRVRDLEARPPADQRRSGLTEFLAVQVGIVTLFAVGRGRGGSKENRWAQKKDVQKSDKKIKNTGSGGRVDRSETPAQRDARIAEAERRRQQGG